MIYLVWSVLNAVLLLYFFYLLIGFIVQGRKIFGGKLMPLSITVMALGVVHLVNATIPEEDSPEIFITEEVKEYTETDYKRITLEDNFAFDVDVALTYTVENGQVIPVESNSSLYGLVLGFNWDLHTFSTSRNSEIGQAHYTAAGSLEWNLFGFNIYTQDKRFAGKL